MVRKIKWSILGMILITPILSLIHLSLIRQWVFPKLYGITYSFDKWNILYTSDNELINSYILSILISCSVAITSTFLAFIISKKLIMDYNMRKWLKWILIPYLIAPVIFGSMLQYFFVRLNLIATVFGVIFSQLIFILPYAITFFSIFWTAKVRNLTHSAYLLGASKLKVYKSLLIPIAKPFIILCFLQCFLISWFEYGITQVIGIGKINTLTVQTMKYIVSSNIQTASISSLLLVFSAWLVILFLFLLYKLKWGS